MELAAVPIDLCQGSMRPFPDASSRRLEQPFGEGTSCLQQEEGVIRQPCNRLGSGQGQSLLAQWSAVRDIARDMTRGKESLKQWEKKKTKSFNAICLKARRERGGGNACGTLYERQ